MKYCNNCGKQLEDNVRFCPSCGTHVMNTTYTYDTVRQNVPSNDYGTISLVCGIVSFFLLRVICAIVALVLASKEKKLNGGFNSTEGKVGMICAIISLIISGITFIIGVIYFAVIIGAIRDFSSSFGISYTLMQLIR